MIQTSLSLGILYFGIYLILILFSLRILRSVSPSLQVCAGALLVYCLGLAVIIIENGSIHFFPFSAFYWFLSLSMIMIFGAVYKSISLRMLLHLLSQPGRRDSYQAILENYIKNQSYHKRLDILVEKKWLEKAETLSFRLTPKGSGFAKNLWRVQQLFSIKESG